MDEANHAASHSDELLWRHRSAVALVYDDTVEPHAMCGTVGLKASTDPGIRPAKMVDCQCPLAIDQGERHCDEQAALEGPDLRDVANGTLGRLSCKQANDDAPREQGRHSGDDGVAIVEVTSGGCGHALSV